MKLHHQAIYAAASVLAALTLTACGGTSVPGAGANKPVQQQPAYTLQAGSEVGTVAQGRAPDFSLITQTAPAHTLLSPADSVRGISAAGVDLSQLPTLPPLNPRTMLAPLKSASADLAVDLANAYDSLNAVAATGSLELAAPAGGLSWAIYEVPLAQYDQPLNVLLRGSVAQTGDLVWLGLSNYRDGRWEFGDAGMTFFSFNELHNYPTLSGYASGLPATYVLVLAFDGDGATLTSLNVRTQELVPAALPMQWATALQNVGLGSTTPGMASVIGSGIDYAAFSWAGNNYDDLRTTLPAFWGAWYGEPGDSYPEFGTVGQFPAYTRDLSDTLNETTSLQAMFLEAANEFPVDKRPTAQTSNPTLDATNPLGSAIAAYIIATGSTADVPAINAACAPMPLEQQNALAEVVAAALVAYQARQTELDAITGTFSFTEGDWVNLFDFTHGGPTGLECLIAPGGAYSPIVYNSNNGWLRGWPYPAMLFNGAALLADAIDNLEAYIAANSPAWENISLDFPSQGGQVTIGGTGDDTFTAPGDGNGHAILIDLGGNDTYDCHAGGTASIKNGIALCLDLGGNDIYNRLDDPDDGNRGTDTDDNTSQQGAGRYGIGILADFAGDDNYTSVRMSQGSAVMGVGILADYAGADHYIMEALGQGGALGGVGLLWDRGGVDVYQGYSKVQGCGLLMGVGFLVDSAADGDQYFCSPLENVNKPEYYSATDGANLTIGQGCGWGARWGWLEASNTGSTGTVGAGGLGLLFDGGGADSYTSGAFAGGCGFFEGLGLLIDRNGADSHNGHAYAYGSAIHYAAGLLWDAAGNDNYNVAGQAGVGGAQNASLAWLIDRAGDDTYTAGEFGLGSGLANGFGYFLDLMGGDNYSANVAGFQDTCLGKGNLGDGAAGNPTYGIFLDLNGHDVYDAAFMTMVNSSAWPGNGASWIRTLEQNVGDPPADYTLGKGSGLDTVEE